MWRAGSRHPPPGVRACACVRVCGVGEEKEISLIHVCVFSIYINIILIQENLKPKAHRARRRDPPTEQGDDDPAAPHEPLLLRDASGAAWLAPRLVRPRASERGRPGVRAPVGPTAVAVLPEPERRIHGQPHRPRHLSLYVPRTQTQPRRDARGPCREAPREYLRRLAVSAGPRCRVPSYTQTAQRKAQKMRFT